MTDRSLNPGIGKRTKSLSSGATGRGMSARAGHNLEFPSTEVLFFRMNGVCIQEFVNKKPVHSAQLNASA